MVKFLIKWQMCAYKDKRMYYKMNGVNKWIIDKKYNNVMATFI